MIMKKAVVNSLFCVVGVFVALISSGNCQSEALSREVAEETYAKADKLLNQTYQNLSKLLDEEEKKELVAIQKAWVKMRDLKANKAAKPLEGSNMYNMIRNETLMELTVKRYSELLIEYFHVYERKYYDEDR